MVNVFGDGAVFSIASDRVANDGLLGGYFHSLSQLAAKFYFAGSLKLERLLDVSFLVVQFLPLSSSLYPEFGDVDSRVTDV